MYTTIPYAGTGNLILIYNGATGAFISFMETTTNATTPITLEYADNQILTNTQMIGLGASNYVNNAWSYYMQEYPLDIFSYNSAYGAMKSVNMNTIINATARQEYAQIIMSSCTAGNYSITCSCLTNNILVVAGYTAANDTFQVPRLTGVPSSFWILPTFANATSTKVPFVIVYSAEDGEVITAGRMLDTSDAANNILPTAVAFCMKTQSVIIAFVSAIASTNTFRYSSIYNNNVLNYLNITRYKFTTPVSGCFMMRMNLTNDYSHMTPTSGGIMMSLANTTIQDIKIVLNNKNTPCSEFLICGYTINPVNVAGQSSQTGANDNSTNIAFGCYSIGANAAATTLLTGLQTPFVVRYRDDCSGANGNGSYLDMPAPCVLGGAWNILPSVMNFDSTNSLAMVGSILGGSGVIRSYSLVSEWIPYTSDTSGNWSASSVSGGAVSNICDGSSTSLWSVTSSFNVTTGTPTGSAPTVTFNIITQYEMPFLISGIRIIVGSSTDTTRPKTIQITYLSATTSTTLTAYTSSTPETYNSNILEIFWATPALANTVTLAILTTYGGTSANIYEVKYFATSPWFPIVFREDPSNSRRLFGPVVTNSTNSQCAEFVFTNTASTTYYYDSAVTSTLKTNTATYSGSGGLYSGSNSRGGDWINFNFINRYGYQRSVSQVRILGYNNNTCMPRRFKINTVTSGVETSLYECE